jgi:hypothetical protein
MNSHRELVESKLLGQLIRHERNIEELKEAEEIDILKTPYDNNLTIEALKQNIILYKIKFRIIKHELLKNHISVKPSKHADILNDYDSLHESLDAILEFTSTEDFFKKDSEGHFKLDKMGQSERPVPNKIYDQAMNAVAVGISNFIRYLYEGINGSKKIFITNNQKLITDSLKDFSAWVKKFDAEGLQKQRADIIAGVKTKEKEALSKLEMTPKSLSEAKPKLPPLLSVRQEQSNRELH